MSNFEDQFKLLSKKTLTLDKLWGLKKFVPNNEQREAILHVDGPLYLTAGPGSGKTRVLLWRTVNLIVFHSVKPEEIFLSTFTEKAAHQLKEGLRTLLGMVTNFNGQPYDLTSMYIGTVHSLCQRTLSDRRHFVVDRHRNRPPQLLDELGQYFHLSRNRNWKDILSSSGLDLNENAHQTINAIWDSKYPSMSKHVAVANCISIFNRFSEECIEPDQAVKLIKKAEKHYQQFDLSTEQIELLVNLYNGYRKSLQLDGGIRLTDFALLQQEAFNLLNAYEGSKKVFKHVIVDEYQDTNSIQERIFFRLAAGTKNICVVGDDDQALYRFRGATVENFVEFPDRCKQYFKVKPHRISLDTNYRSPKQVVDFYGNFIKHADWRNPSGGHYRVAGKNIQAHSSNSKVTVVASKPDKPEMVCAEIARLARQLLDEGKVENPNQIAVLFPSFKYQGEMATAVKRMKLAFEEVGLEVYAPRAGSFLEVEESLDVFGLLLHIFGHPPQGEYHGRDYDRFRAWADIAETRAKALMIKDQLLKRYVQERKDELESARSDYETLSKVVEKNHWNTKEPYQPEKMKRVLFIARGLSEQAKKLLSSAYLDRLINERIKQGNPFSLLYVLRRITSIDWNVLDVFYRLCGFEHFKKMFDLAENNGDEGPVANLGLITQYLSRFLDERISIITADLIMDKTLQIVFFAYLFSLYRLGESEYEDADDPFPKGRVPFLTIHQSKGLEFPVVILGNLRKDNKGPNHIEKIIHPLVDRPEGEPLDRMSEFDIMRMFYVALSRAKNLLILAHFKGAGQRINEPFKTMLDGDFPRIADFKVSSLTKSELKEELLPKSYSFTSDFLLYKKCPRQYMIFRKFGFVPSRAQTMFFGSLVHRTLEDLHHELIRRRSEEA